MNSASYQSYSIWKENNPFANATERVNQYYLRECVAKSKLTNYAKSRPGLVNHLIKAGLINIIEIQ